MIVPKLSFGIRVGLISNPDCQYAVCYILSAPKKDRHSWLVCRRMIDLAVEPIPGSTRCDAICRCGRPKHRVQDVELRTSDLVPERFPSSSRPMDRISSTSRSIRSCWIVCNSRDQRPVEQCGHSPAPACEAQCSFDDGILAGEHSHHDSLLGTESSVPSISDASRALQSDGRTTCLSRI